MAQMNALQAKQEFNKVVNSADEILDEVEGVFPLDFFPDRIAIDRTQVTVVERMFFGTGDVTSIRIEDILDVTAYVGPFFGALHIKTRFFGPEHPYVVRNLWRDDALRLKAVILGLVIAVKDNIDTTAIGKAELLPKLVRLGQGLPMAEIM